MGNIHTIQGELTIYTATVQLEECFSALTNGINILDFSGVHDLDSAALALILVCRREAERLQKPLQCINLPENLKNLATLYGVENYIPT